MSFDLTNKNISETFQNLLQKTGSEGYLYDLVGNKVENLTIDGTLTANSYVTSESIVNTSSGSTAFGNTADDSHTFIGHITASGNISASGDVYANEQYFLEGVSAFAFAPGDNWILGDPGYGLNFELDFPPNHIDNPHYQSSVADFGMYLICFYLLSRMTYIITLIF